MVNCNILYYYKFIEYTSTNDAIADDMSLDRETMIITRNLLENFSYIFISPSDYWLLGFYWNNAYKIDIFSFFALSTFFYTFDLFAKALLLILLVTSWLMLYSWNNFITFLIPSINFTPYKDYFDFFCKI